MGLDIVKKMRVGVDCGYVKIGCYEDNKDHIRLTLEAYASKALRDSGAMSAILEPELIDKQTLNPNEWIFIIADEATLSERSLAAEGMTLKKALYALIKAHKGMAGAIDNI